MGVEGVEFDLVDGGEEAGGGGEEFGDLFVVLEWVSDECGTLQVFGAGSLASLRLRLLFSLRIEMICEHENEASKLTCFSP